MRNSPLHSAVERAVTQRERALTTHAQEQFSRAFRVMNGFVEGHTDWVVECYGTTLVLHDYRAAQRETTSADNDTQMQEATALAELFASRWPWLECVLWKRRSSSRASERNGVLLLGTTARLCTEVQESSVRYRVNLMLNRDCSFYLDTQVLRSWLLANSRNSAVLNLFAYTGSLGVAALAGGATRVLQVDRSERFLSLAAQSCALNDAGYDLRATERFLPRHRAVIADFFAAVAKLKQRCQRDSTQRFDRVIVDPPFQSDTALGSVDLARDTVRLLNKVRPLLADNGVIAFVNNALYLSGAELIKSLDEVCADGFVSLEAQLDVDDDSVGYLQGEVPSSCWPKDPAPFRHPTKIVLLRVRRR
jgi:23S rRNA (cytosine1962-C5)-methyltransferase